jgi:hypothetical protein
VADYLLEFLGAAAAVIPVWGWAGAVIAGCALGCIGAIAEKRS